MTPRLRLYAAISLDGCLADSQGEVGWLGPFEAEDYGTAGFLAGIATVLTGRATYDQARGFGDWPYAGKRMVVLTHRPLDADPPAGVEAAAGDVAAIVARLKAEAAGDIWLLGGAAVAQHCLALDLVDSIELFIVPVTLGAGPRLFAAEGAARGWRLVATRPFPNGVVAVEYGRV
ncbi:dihydrofolate reductase [Roseomonas eburnea]|uniref:Dihydrofolate reductase n=1 Tax=Neoroseomonas eburnea TaxID=1346889 RepID=A0A9X9XJV4_9PROT|nr:dihydrofolate reductase family protein [Neoroseomonas eburnea]MBR0683990.1 dihydrofolate reductase [Neoroseomonas eburnea]